MTKSQPRTRVADPPLVRLESKCLRVDVAPAVGGRIVSIQERTTGYEFLWRNAALPLVRLAAGSEYDPNFYGGIYELLPNDIPETINGIDCPDHGELWTTPLDWELDGQKLCLAGRLPRFGIDYERIMILRDDAPWIDLDYRISNRTGSGRSFLWKLHAALRIQAGDRIDCPAQKGRVVDLTWSRHTTLQPFAWPMVENQAANVIPERDGTVDFFYLYELEAGRLAWRRPSGRLLFEYRFDPEVFRYAWLFASYGGFNGHYTAVLEPCTAMPISVNEAAANGQCTRLEPGQTLSTRVSIYAGPAESEPASHSMKP
jgi:hypothetical protein